MLNFIIEMCKICDNIAFSYSNELKSLRLHISKENKTLIYHIPKEIFKQVNNFTIGGYTRAWKSKIDDDFYKSTHMERGTL